uniref:Uncharacterized protein n=1 Tax=Arundo donax TaxID=35708 RepID=A0A0A9BZH7_ARUDO
MPCPVNQPSKPTAALPHRLRLQLTAPSHPHLPVTAASLSQQPAHTRNHGRRGYFPRPISSEPRPPAPARSLRAALAVPHHRQAQASSSHSNFFATSLLLPQVRPPPIRSLRAAPVKLPAR